MPSKGLAAFLVSCGGSTKALGLSLKAPDFSDIPENPPIHYWHLEAPEPTIEDKLSRADAASGDCECVTWEAARDKHDASCGNRGEMECAHFIKKLPNEKFCIKQDGTEDANSKPQWCYVSNQCKHGKTLEWGFARDLKWRECRTDEPTLGDKSVEELFLMSMQHNLDMIALTHWGYTVSSYRLPQAFSFYGVDRLQDINGTDVIVPDPLGKLAQAAFQELQDSGKRFVFQYNARAPPFGVAEGKKLWYINFGFWPVAFSSRTANGKIFKPRSHMPLVTETACIAGCDTETAPLSPPWWHEWNERYGGSLRTTNTDVCDCVGWEDAFANYSFSCDKGGDEFCKYGLKRLTNKDRFCVQGGSEEMFCVVNETCSASFDHPWGHTVNGNIKVCDNDAKLADYSMEELVELSRARDIDVALLVLMSRRQAPAYVKFGMMLNHTGLRAVHDDEGNVGAWSREPTGKAAQFFREQMSHNESFYVASPGKTSPILLVEREKVWWINSGNDLVERLYIKNESLHNHTSLINHATCVKGCENVSAPLWNFFINAPFNDNQ